MTESVMFARVTYRVILVEDCVRAVASDEAGAVVSFAGVVRDHDNGRVVVSLDYEAHPSAGDVIRSVADATSVRFRGVKIAIEHRIGSLVVGEVALACAVSSAHRAEAFAACAQLVDDVKAGVPIWKEQHFADGTSEWVGIENSRHRSETDV